MDNSELFKMDDEVKSEVDAMNSMIENEKLAQEEISNEENKESLKEKSPKKVSIESTDVVTSMERLHLRVFEDCIDVLYRPNHCYVSFLPNNENGKEEVRRIAKMTRDEFREYLKKSKCFSFSSASKMEAIRNSDNEKWYKGAWSMSTKRLLDELGVVNPVEEEITE